MKKFIKKTILFLFLAVVFIEILSGIIVFTKLYLIGCPGNEIYYSIEKSKRKNKSKILLIGDSVGNQLFSNRTNNDGINSLACNQAIGVVGQYLLLNNYLKTGNKIEKAYMVLTPFSFKNNLDQVFTYHYFLKPFYSSEYDSLFTETVKQQIKKIPYHQFTKIPHILVTTWAPKFIPTKEVNYTFLSPISIEYLIKIKELSTKHNFELTILPTPTSSQKRELIERFDTNEFAKADLAQEFENYFNKIIYLDSIEFYDGTHLIHPENYTVKYKNELVK